MRAFCVGISIALAVLFVGTAWTEEKSDPKIFYDGCLEQGYDSVDEPCGGGHQHQAGERNENSLDLARHRHRYLEEQIRVLGEKVASLSAEVDKLKGGK